MKLHHTVNHTPEDGIAKSIEALGLIPQVAVAYKDLVPEDIRHLPVVWLAEGVWQGYDLPVFEIDSKYLDEERLFYLTDKAVEDVNWWVYQGHIPRERISRVQIPSSQ